MGIIYEARRRSGSPILRLRARIYTKRDGMEIGERDHQGETRKRNGESNK